jgi:hypothetical protein
MNSSSHWFLSSPLVAPCDHDQHDDGSADFILDLQPSLPTGDQVAEHAEQQVRHGDGGEDAQAKGRLAAEEQNDSDPGKVKGCGASEITIIGKDLHQQGYRLLRAGVAAPDDTKSYQGLFPSTPEGVVLQLFDHQLHALNRILQIFLQNLGALLAYDMGLGKTLIVIGEVTNLPLLLTELTHFY